MSDEEMRVAIAEACGFERWKSLSGNVTLVKPTEKQRAYWTSYGDGVTTDPVKYWRDVPDYLNDLNAMLEVCRYAKQHLMDADQWHEFGRFLEAAHPTAVLLDIGRIDYWDLATLIADLTARHIATAFLKALGKCKEEA